MVFKELEEKYGPQCLGDNPFTRKARLLQSFFREITIKEKEFGRGPNKNSVHILKDENGHPTGETIPSFYGNMLVKGDESNKNFFYLETYHYAVKRVREKTKDETIDDYRLFNNMLSSMPMAFNLFHPLMMIKEKYPDALNKMIQDAFPSLPVYSVEEIKIEFIPVPIDEYTNDKSAMDAAIFFKDIKGNCYLIAIETKYTDSLGTNKAKDNALKFCTAKELNQFTDDGIKFIETGCPQIYRNYLLAEKYGQVHNFKDTYSIILAPKDHPTTTTEINLLRTKLKPQFHYKIEKNDLESFIEKLKINCPQEFCEWLNNFYTRYLDFALAENLLKQ